MIGRSIGNYEITRMLGEGGMGTVYLAVHPKLGRKVAVKVLRPGFCTDPDLVSRFFQEARAANEIGHPNIVDVADFGETEDGLAYLVMELLEGETLRDRLDGDAKLPITVAVHVARQIAAALGAAHRHGIVHRDLKPDNVFLVRGEGTPGSERVKLFDFGIAKLLGDRGAGHKTEAGAMLGTPYYMSPEQVRSEEIDGRSDVYALGVLLYQMLTGRVPFRPPQLVLLLDAIVREPPEPPTLFRRDLPADIERVVLRCLEKDPAARPADMDALIRELGGTPDRMAVPDTPALSPALAATMAAHPSDNPTLAAALPTQRLRPGGPPKPVAPPAPSLKGQARIPTTQVPLMSQLRTMATTNKGRALLGLGAMGPMALLVAILSAVLDDAPIPAPPPEPTPPPRAELLIDSVPRGAEVRRVFDVRSLGRTPVHDSQPADGRVVEYQIRLAHHSPQRVTWRFTAPGRHATTVNLGRLSRPIEPQAARVAATKRARFPTRKDQLPPVAPARPAQNAAPVEAWSRPPATDPLPVKRLFRR